MPRRKTPLPSPLPPNRIAEIREERGYSMEQLAQRVVPAATASQINKLEKSKQSLTVEWIYRLANALECGPTELLPFTTRQAARLAHMYDGLAEPARQATFTVADAFTQRSQQLEGEPGANYDPGPVQRLRPR